MATDHGQGFSTRAIHGGLEPDPATGAVMTPVYLTSTYAQEAPGVHKGYDYARTANPTRTALQKNVAALEEQFKPALKSSFVPLERSTDVFSWDPV